MFFRGCPMALARALPAKSTTSDSECQNWCDFFGGSHDVMIQMPNDYVMSHAVKKGRQKKFWRSTNCVDLRVPICAKNWSLNFAHGPSLPEKTTIGKADHPFVPETSHKTMGEFSIATLYSWRIQYLNLSGCTQPKMQTQAACPQFSGWLFKDC